ncbi:hypothetical protein EYF80_025655 [Liparis tanakae]|uniref:Uncharacterized protein n=1 Tax=Liparis tanakae TaxID=230148 RepID=A0A4Z2HE61_9TELE|nr:hypothetical protein EYF80_025655 [Liparis tanakae]
MAGTSQLLELLLPPREVTGGLTADTGRGLSEPATEVLRHPGLSKQRSSRLLALLAEHTHAFQPFLQQLQETRHGRHVGQKPPAALDEVSQLQLVSFWICWEKSAVDRKRREKMFSRSSRRNMAGTASRELLLLLL